MSKFKIEHGASRINLVPLKTNIKDTIAQDIDLLAEWSNNDRKYIVNELLRFAISQEEDFLKHKANVAAAATQSVPRTRPASVPVKPVTEQGPKSDPSTAGSSTHV